MSEVRLPLQVGTSAFWSLLRSAALFMPSALVFFGLLVPSIYLVVELPDLLFASDFIGKIILAIIVGVLAAPFFVLRSAVKHFGNALGERPSDVVLGEGNQVTVIGGPYNGRTFDGGTCNIDSTRHSQVEIVELTLDGEVVSRAARPLEQESLRTLHDTLVARSHARPIAPAKPSGVSLLCCVKCGAAVAPDDAETVACKFCGESTPVPAALREKVRAVRTFAADRPRNERMIARLLRQPSARVVWGVMIALGVPMLLVWPACAYFVLRMYREGVLSAIGVLTLVFASIVAIGALFVLMRITLVNRQALSLVSARFSALPPDKPNAPYACRMCQAPLPVAKDQMLVRCAYCDADNILGLDLRARAGVEAAQHRSIDDELARRRHERRLWHTTALVTIAVVGTFRWVVPFALRPHTDLGRCHVGDAAACVRVAKRIESKKMWNEDIRDALELYRRACQAHDQQSCRDAARVAYSWAATVFDGYVDTVPDLRTGCDLGDGTACSEAALRIDEKLRPEDFFELTKRACDLGHAGGCSDHGYAFANGVGAAKDDAQALVFYRLGCDRGNRLGCANAGFNREHANDFAGAAAFFERACPRGSTDEDLCAKAAKFYRRRCDDGDTAACAPR